MPRRATLITALAAIALEDDVVRVVIPVELLRELLDR